MKSRHSPRPGRTAVRALALAATLLAHGGRAHAQRVDPVARLQARLDSGTAVLAFDTVTGWLPSVLDALDVPVSSQTLVFSRTSLQTDRIGPWAPRALYFNDDIYIGFVQEGGLLEVAAVEPTGGVAFYSLTQEDAETPTFQREGSTCLMCHESRSLTGGVPGLLLRSVLPDRLGYPIGEIHEGVTTTRTPMDQRWGGWYVTDAEGLSHAGNVYAPDLRADISDVRSYVQKLDFSAPREAETLIEAQFDASPYLSGSSDVVALSALAHQVEVHNLISMAHETTQTAMRESGIFTEEAARDATIDDLRDAARARVERVAERLVDGLLFVHERPLAAPLSGSSSWAEEFQARAPRYAAGRSLRDLDLEARLFRYPLSYLVYTETFAALPPPVKGEVYRLLADVLSGTIVDERFAHLEPATRQTILEILQETLDGFKEGT